MWFKVDDQLAFHPKAMAAGNEAIGLWVRAGAWCSAYLTDGRIPKAVAHSMASDMANAIELANRLLMAKLWLDDGDDYVFHDWDEFQPSASKELAKREEISEKRKIAGQKGARARWSKVDDSKSDGKCHSKSHGKTMAPGWQNDGPVPVPVPTNSPNGENMSARAPRGRATEAEPDGFADFYAAYPRKEKRRTAAKAYAAALRRADPTAILTGAQRFAADPNLPERRYIPHPATWLNGDGWDDDPLPERRPSGGVARHSKPSEAEWWEQQLAAASQPPPEDRRQIESWGTA